MSDDRTLAALRALIRAEFPRLSYLGEYEYVIDAFDGTSTTSAKSIDASPVDASLGLPAVTRVPLLMPFGVSPKAGLTCAIVFLNGDPAKPRCVGLDLPPRLELGGDTARDAARKGDLVNIVLPPFQFTGTATVSGVPTPMAGTMVVASGGQTLAAITSGSTKVGIAT